MGKQIHITYRIYMFADVRLAWLMTYFWPTIIIILDFYVIVGENSVFYKVVYPM